MLKEKVEDAKGLMLTTFAELERQCKTLEELGGQLRKRHACWPSRAGWWGMLCLVGYVLFLHGQLVTKDTVQDLSNRVARLDNLETRLTEKIQAVTEQMNALQPSLYHLGEWKSWYQEQTALLERERLKRLHGIRVEA